jgi:hypothetical protein
VAVTLRRAVAVPHQAEAVALLPVDREAEAETPDINFIEI